MIPLSNLYLLGVLNSKLIWLFLTHLCPILGDPQRGGRLRLKTIYTRTIPIRQIDFTNLFEREAHAKIVRKVEEMLALQKQRARADRELDDARHSLAVRIRQLDEEIDALVYQLYELTEEEIRIVEGW